MIKALILSILLLLMIKMMDLSQIRIRNCDLQNYLTWALVVGSVQVAFKNFRKLRIECLP